MLGAEALFTPLDTQAFRVLSTIPQRQSVSINSIVLGQTAGVEHVSFYSRTELPASIYSTP